MSFKTILIKYYNTSKHNLYSALQNCVISEFLHHKLNGYSTLVLNLRTYTF